MDRRLLGWTCVALLLSGCGGDEPVGPEVLGPDDIRYSGTVTLDGSPIEGRVVALQTLDQCGDNYCTERVTQDVVDATGAYSLKRDGIGEEACDNLWLEPNVENVRGSLFHYLLDGCGEHVVNVEFTTATNVEVTGTITVGGEPYSNGPVSGAVGNLPPNLGPIRWIDSGETNLAGEYSIAGRVDPSLCDDIWIWVKTTEGSAPNRSLNEMVKVPGCGPQVVDIDAPWSN
jgi:hypothetical protein